MCSLFVWFVSGGKCCLNFLGHLFSLDFHKNRMFFETCILRISCRVLTTSGSVLETGPVLVGFGPPNPGLWGPQLQYIAFNTYYLYKHKGPFVFKNVYKSMFLQHQHNIWSRHTIPDRPLSMERNPFSAQNWTLRSYRVYISPTKQASSALIQIESLIQIGIISSYSNRIPDRLQTLAFTKFQARKMTFSWLSTMQMVWSIQSYLMFLQFRFQ